MRATLSFAMTCLLFAELAPAGQDAVATQLAAIPTGARIEVRLKSQQAIRGSKGSTADSGFTLAATNAGDRQIAFADVASVRQLKSHALRNVLIIAGIGVAALAITIGVMLRCGAFGCGPGLKI